MATLLVFSPQALVRKPGKSYGKSFIHLLQGSAWPPCLFHTSSVDRQLNRSHPLPRTWRYICNYWEILFWLWWNCQYAGIWSFFWMEWDLRLFCQVEEGRSNVLKLLFESDDVGNFLSRNSAKEVPFRVIKLWNRCGGLHFLYGLRWEKLWLMRKPLLPNSLIPISLTSSLQNLTLNNFLRTFPWTKLT